MNVGETRVVEPALDPDRFDRTAVYSRREFPIQHWIGRISIVVPSIIRLTSRIIPQWITDSQPTSSPLRKSGLVDEIVCTLLCIVLGSRRNQRLRACIFGRLTFELSVIIMWCVKRRSSRYLSYNWRDHFPNEGYQILTKSQLVISRWLYHICMHYIHYMLYPLTISLIR